jgi:hypothetical protein
MSQVEAKSRVLESGSQALLGDEPKVEENEEFVDLGVDSTGSSLDETPAKPAAKPQEKPAAAAKDDGAGDSVTTEGDDEVPPELKGKTPAQLAKMYRDAQSVIGRQGSELGEFRRKADLLIQASLANLQRKQQEASPPAPKEQPTELDDSEFFAKPKETISKAIENHPLIKEIRETLGKSAADAAKTKAEKATERFNTAHPDAETIMADSEFRDWVKASRVRTNLLAAAHLKFDFDAGDEVFSTWKALKGIKKPAADTAGADTSVSDAARTLAAARAKQKREQQLKDAAAPTGGNGGAAKSESKKIYRRADVLRLMETDPKRYEAMADEIRIAYAEKRVR